MNKITRHKLHNLLDHFPEIEPLLFSKPLPKTFIDEVTDVTCVSDTDTIRRLMATADTIIRTYGRLQIREKAPHPI